VGVEMIAVSDEALSVVMNSRIAALLVNFDCLWEEFTVAHYCQLQSNSILGLKCLCQDFRASITEYADVDVSGQPCATSATCSVKDFIERMSRLL
jgi:hypothetical protein